VKQNLRTISNRWELSIFTIILLYTNNFLKIFERLKKNEDISFFAFSNSLNLNENTYTYIKFGKQITIPNIVLLKT
jgi:hypothetical protein